MATGTRTGMVGRRSGGEIGCASSRSGILLSTRTRNTRNIIDVCAPRVCRVIGRRKLTCERPGNIARIKKPDEMGKKRASERVNERAVGGVRIKIGGCAFVRFALFFRLARSQGGRWRFCVFVPLRVSRSPVFARGIMSIILLSSQDLYLHTRNIRRKFAKFVLIARRASSSCFLSYFMPHTFAHIIIILRYSFTLRADPASSSARLQGTFLCNI